MGDISRIWRKAAAVTLTAALMAQGGSALAEESAPQQWLELTAPVLETEAGAKTAVTADLKIGEWLSYRDYGIKRDDVDGGTYSFALTTRDAEGNLINDGQLAYCVQSYFMAPLPGDHSEEMIDQVVSINGGKNLNKVFYYGYGGAAYDAAEFEAVLKNTDSAYFENVYQQLDEQKKEELAYILTHSASTYAYFNDGTDLEEYFSLQFQVKYGDDWEKQYGYFKEIEMNAAAALNGDMNLYGSTYGMNDLGIELVKNWYQVLTEKEEPGLDVEESDGMFTFIGNEKNEELKMEFVVPDGFACEVQGAEGNSVTAKEAETVSIEPGDSFQLICTEGQISTEKDGIAQLNVEVTADLLGTEKEAWNVVLLETNKGNANAVSRRQQDIGAISMTDAGRTDLTFQVELEKGTMELVLKDEVQQPVSGAVLGVYYDEECTEPLMQDGKALELTTDADGRAYLEYVLDEKMESLDGRLYAKELSAPEGNAVDETVYCMEAGVSQDVVNARVFEETPVEITCQVALDGRDLKDGEFAFELVQVADESGETVLEGGVTSSAVNDAEGNVVFEGITVSEPGTYYYKITCGDDSFIAKAEVAADEENKGQLSVSVTYPDGEPVLEKVYEASGEARVQGIQVQAENGELEAGAYVFELKDADGNVVSQGTNDAEGNVKFDSMTFTQDDIGKTYEYTVSMVTEDGEEAGQEVKVGMQIEDGERSDGTLQILQSVLSEGLEFKVQGEAETEEVSEAQSVSETEEVRAKESTSETEEVSAAESVSETEAVSETETETETSDDSQRGYVLPITISILVLLILLVIFWYRKKGKKA